MTLTNMSEFYIMLTPSLDLDSSSWDFAQCLKLGKYVWWPKHYVGGRWIKTCLPKKNGSASIQRNPVLGNTAKYLCFLYSSLQRTWLLLSSLRRSWLCTDRWFSHIIYLAQTYGFKYLYVSLRLIRRGAFGPSRRLGLPRRSFLAL